MMGKTCLFKKGLHTYNFLMHTASRLFQITPWFCCKFTVDLVILCLLLQIFPALGDQDAQKCSYNEELTEANCSARGLQNTPWGLHQGIQTLDLSGNSFRRQLLLNKSFLGYIYLYDLYLRNNSLRGLEKESLINLKYLKVLDLTNNLLEAVPETALQPVAKSLEKLLLAGNKIYQLPANAFSGLVKLQHLDLSGNSIYQVHYHAFKGLQSLLILKLRHNALKTLPVNAFEDFPDNMEQVQLYDNRWFCDCQLRWLRLWMNKTDTAVWNSTGYHVRCDGPSIVRDMSLDSRSLNELACEVQMKTSGGTLELTKGANTSILCKYSSIPKADAKWLRNSEIINVKPMPKGKHLSGPAAIAVVPPSTSPSAKNEVNSKYLIQTSIMEGYHNDKTQVSELIIHDFNTKDIALYKCFVQNIRGGASTEYRLTLAGMDFNSPSQSDLVRKSDSAVDTHSIVIAMAVVCGIILIVAIGMLIICSVHRMQRQRREKREAIEETVKQHFIENSELMMKDDSSQLPNPKRFMENHQDDGHYDQRLPSSNDSAAITFQNPSNLDADKNNVEPPFMFQQPGSPFNNGNTYVSFGGELTDPGDFTMLPFNTVGRGKQHQSQLKNPLHSKGYESSHAGSGTPLLDRATPSVLDSDEPVEDYAQYPVYDSLTNTLQRPNGETSSIHGSSLHQSVHPNEGVYGGPLCQGESIYGGSLHEYPSRTPKQSELIPVHCSFRTCAEDSPLTLSRDFSDPHGEPAKRLSSFHNSTNTHFPLPRTPTNARPSSTLPAPVPRYADQFTDYSSVDSHRLRLDHHNPALLVLPSPHNLTMPSNMDYRDYREMHCGIYPGQKSMSVGNLGHLPFSAPRKPPRLFQSREYMELAPTEQESRRMTPPLIASDADYITSAEARQYGQSFGITPGTPV